VADGLLPEPGWIVTAVGSGGTAAGLALGLRLAGLRTRVLGIVVNDTLRLDGPTLTRLARRSLTLLRDRGADLPRTEPGPAGIVTEYGWLGAGYAHPTARGAAALDLAASEAGLALEQTYTAKALAALLELDAAGRFGGEPVVFLNTFGPRQPPVGGGTLWAGALLADPRGAGSSGRARAKVWCHLPWYQPVYARR
jgi:D-cysteine desulfhydrase